MNGEMLQIGEVVDRAGLSLQTKLPSFGEQQMREPLDTRSRD